MRKKPSKIEDIILYRQEKPTLTLQQIGEQFKVSKQYIHKVLKANDSPTIAVKKRKVGYCLVCKTCIENHKGYIKRICSQKCKFKYHNIKVNCAFCRIPFYRKRHQIIQRYRDKRYKKYIYCTKHCYNKAQRDGQTKNNT